MKYLIPRMMRETLATIKQFVLKLINSDSSRLKPYKSYFSHSNTIFIHIPKCAGTSVAFELYGVDPWHHSVKEFTDIQLHKSTVFAVYRDPVGRFMSSYYYLKSRAKHYPDSIYSDAANCKGPEEFFKKYIFGKKDEQINYFLRSQKWYLTDNDGNVRVDFLVNMEFLEQEFPLAVRNIFKFYSEFPRKNTAGKITKEPVSPEFISLVKLHYKEDYKLLNL